MENKEKNTNNNESRMSDALINELNSDINKLYEDIESVLNDKSKSAPERIKEAKAMLKDLVSTYGAIDIWATVTGSKDPNSTEEENEEK